MKDIALRVGRIIDRVKMRKHFDLVFGDGFLSFARDTSSIEQIADLDGIFVLRTNVKKEVSSAEDTVVTYKSLSLVEGAFRSMKVMDICIRPIRYFTGPCARACFLVHPGQLRGVGATEGAGRQAQVVPSIRKVGVRVPGSALNCQRLALG